MLLPLDVLSLVFSAWSLAGIAPAHAALLNVTIDDSLGDSHTGALIAYEPPTRWSAGRNCTDCSANLDHSKVLDGTWHEALFTSTHERDGVADVPLIASAKFEGVALYVFCVVAHTSGNTDLRFLLDGEHVGSFVQPPIGSSHFEYNVPVYVNESISPGEHTLSIINGQPLGNESLVLLDYIVYS
ncbi:uncharacterized protein BXZ73DRAFT_3132, partial [Epithele typhae]|uniref:uncharacterized protein n=1 Tax=Epithele typhae TaxID=378194 RepID=UPI00200809B5